MDINIYTYAYTGVFHYNEVTLSELKNKRTGERDICV